MSENGESQGDGYDSDTYMIMGEFLHIGGRFQGWTYCVGCNKQPQGLLSFQSCVHRMCIECKEAVLNTLGCKSDTSELECPNCGESSILCETNERELAIIAKLDQAVVKLQPFLDKILKATEKKNANSDESVKRSVKKSSSGKRNARGETDLQIACIAGNLELVKELIALGADVNAQDNSGWTSLHEAAFYNNKGIALALLMAGALVDIPGLLNTTPLHDAAARNNTSVAEVLLKYGASTEARTSKGQRPIDLARTSKMKSVLTTVTKLPQAKSMVDQLADTLVLDPSKILLVAAENVFKDQLREFGVRFKVKTAQSYNEKVTHVVVNAPCKVAKVTFTLLQAILGGKTIVSHTWMAECLQAEKLLQPLDFEVTGTEKFPNSLAPLRARVNAAFKSPGLFNGCNIYLRHSTCLYSGKDLTLTKDEFWQLIRVGGGKVLSREPKADCESEADASMPFHATADSPLAKCYYYIIQWPGDDRIQYNMAHVKTLPVDWFVASIENFKLVDSTSYF